MNLGDIVVVVLGSHGPDGRHAQLRVQRRLLRAVVVQLLLHAVALFLQHGQPLGVAGLLLVRCVLDVAGSHGIGQGGGSIRIGGVRSDGNLIAGSHARHFDGALQPLGGALVAFAALLPYAGLAACAGRLPARPARVMLSICCCTYES